MDTLENLTVMFTDIVGYSDLMEKLSRKEGQKFLEKHNKILSRIIKRFGGQKIKSIGDSFLVIFRSPTDAVICGMALHDALWDEQKNQPQHAMTIRVALHAGEVRLSNNDVFGEAVNIASRIETITPPGSVYLTENVYLSMKKSEVLLTFIDAYDFKGASESIKVYQAKHKPVALSDHQQNAQTSRYPYGGAHINHKANTQPLITVGKYCLSICALLVVIFITWWATITFMPPAKILEREKVIVEYRSTDSLNNQINDQQHNELNSEDLLKQQASALLASNNYIELKQFIANNKEQQSDSSYLQLLQAHSDFYFKHYNGALSNYQLALQAQPVFARDFLTAKNLVALLEHTRQEANQLIASHINPTLVKALSLRTGKSGLTARYDAFYLLKDSGNAESIDRVGLNIWDLKELKQCKLKKIAVIELKRLNDKRALDVLKESLDVGFFDRIKYSCFRKEAKEAIAIMEGKPKKPQEIPIDYKDASH